MESEQGEQKRRYRVLAGDRGGRRLAPGPSEENQQEEKKNGDLDCPRTGLPEACGLELPRGKA